MSSQEAIYNEYEFFGKARVASVVHYIFIAQIKMDYRLNHNANIRNWLLQHITKRNTIKKNND